MTIALGLMALAAHGGGECPTLALNLIGEHLTGMSLTVAFDPAPKTALTYDWTVRGTKITQGQGTATLATEANLPDLFERDHVISGSVTIGGLPPGCVATHPFSVTLPRFGPLPDRDLTAALADACGRARIETVAGKTGTFSHRLVLDPMPAGTLRYDWWVSEGRILSGQGTAGIAHRMNRARARGTVLDYNVTVTIGGLPEGCPPMVIMAGQARSL